MIDRINLLLRKSYIPGIFRVVTLLSFFGLVMLGFTAYSTDRTFLLQLRNTNLGNLIVWSYWWPFIIITAIIFGRVWCFVCPVEMITSFFSKAGFRKRCPEWLRSGWGITIFYTIILFIGIRGLLVHRNPYMMAFYLSFIMVVSIIIGVIYEKNTFCRYFCPVGQLLGLYSKLSFFGWRVKDHEICQSCSDRSCISRNYTYNFSSKSCGVDLYPGKLDDNRYCILCTGCLKACEKYNHKNISGRPNPGIRYLGFAGNFFKHKTLTMAEAFFVFVVSGFVIYEILSEWFVTQEILMYVPNLVKDYFNITNPLLSGLSESTILFLFFPLLIWGPPFLIARLNGSSLGLRDYVRNFAIAFVPIMAASHLSKALLKSTSRIPYFSYVFSDTSGMSTAQKIIDKAILLQKLPEWANWLVTILVSAALITGIALSLKAVRVTGEELSGSTSQSKAFYLIPVLYGSIFLITVLLWRWIKC